MSNELATRTTGVEISNMDELARVADMMAKSGFFTDARDAAQAGVKIMAGQAWGIDPFNAMTGIHIIKNKPTISAGLMAAAVKGHPKYDYRVKRRDDKGCKIEFFEGAESLGVMEFTEADAKRAGLLGQDNYKKHPAAMFFARCMSSGVRTFCPDVFSSSVYTPEELGASVNEEGEIMDVPHRAEPAGPTPAQRAEAVPEGLGASAVALGDEGKLPPEPPTKPTEKPQEAAQPAERTLTDDEAARLAKALTDRGVKVKEHLTFASEVVGREVEALSELTERESRQVFAKADGEEAA